MNKTWIIAKNEWRSIIRNKTAIIMVSAFTLILLLAAYIGSEHTGKQNQMRQKYQSVVQSQWQSQPNRHPHRVAHYGYLVFREKLPLSFFDFGVESFVGNSVFLEAHRQNTVNLSEAEFSNGMLRFGEVNMAMVLQLLVPLFVFFVGFSTVAGLKENGVLKIILSQGISIKKLLWGKIAGIFSFTVVFFLGLIAISFMLEFIFYSSDFRIDTLIRALVTLVSYAIYLGVCAWITVMVSASSKKGSNALVILILLWMVCCIVLPKMSQAIGTSIYPSLSKVQFEKKIKRDLSKEGDPHDPNDPNFKLFRQSILKKYGVDSIQALPVNYAGLVMAEGERITTKLFNKHFDALIDTYKKQNRIGVYLSFINPYLMIRNASMAVAGTDMAHYINFQRQAESYRYKQTQYLNDIHAYKVKSKNDKAQRVDNKLFAARKTFEYEPKDIVWALSKEKLLIISSVFWLILVLISVPFISKKISVV